MWKGQQASCSRIPIHLTFPLLFPLTVSVAPFAAGEEDQDRGQQAIQYTASHVRSLSAR